ncbi:MAG: recombinase family protein [Candidatus Limivivens sp.]|nr:recombinase family protein [Candidatus Limivivens sp.]
MDRRIFGYARVSSKEKNLDRQILELQKYVKPENILVDKASGKDLNREGYQALKGALGLRAGDILYITSLDRLSRNKEETKRELQWFKENKVCLKILDLPTSLVEVPKGQEWILEMIQNILMFTTRLVEAGVNIKVIQELCGHSRSDVTLDIYTTVTKELKQREFGDFEVKLKQQKQEWKERINIEETEEGE